VILPRPPKLVECFKTYEIVCTLTASISFKTATADKSIHQSCNNYEDKTNSFVESTPIDVNGGPKFAPKCKFCCEYYAIENNGTLEALTYNWTPQNAHDLECAIGTCGCCFAKQLETCDYIVDPNQKYKADKYSGGKTMPKRSAGVQDDEEDEEDVASSEKVPLEVMSL